MRYYNQSVSFRQTLPWRSPFQDAAPWTWKFRNIILYTHDQKISLPFKNVLFLLFIRCWKTHLWWWRDGDYYYFKNVPFLSHSYLFLSLVIHHLFHHPSSFTIEVRQLEMIHIKWTMSIQWMIWGLYMYLWIFWLDFLCVDFWISRNDATPPLHLIHLSSEN